jgi:hypothetical protein
MIHAVAMPDASDLETWDAGSVGNQVVDLSPGETPEGSAWPHESNEAIWAIWHHGPREQLLPRHLSEFDALLIVLVHHSLRSCLLISSGIITD